MMAVVCRNVKCKFPFSINPTEYEWREVLRPAVANANPKKVYIATLQCPTCKEAFDRSRQRKP